jgi:hypothetical protein
MVCLLHVSVLPVTLGHMDKLYEHYMSSSPVLCRCTASNASNASCADGERIND